MMIIIPPAVIALTSFWLVEQSRMMRAGNYLQLLENEINIKVGGAYLIWENWLRREGISWRDAHNVHHISQHLGAVGVFYLVSGISLWKIWESRASSHFPLWAWGLYIAMLVFLLVLIILIIQHRPSRRSEFEEWRRKYQEEVLSPRQ